MIGNAAHLASMALALALAAAAAAKLRRPARWSASLAAYRLSPQTRRALAVAVPALEVAVAALLLAGPPEIAALAALALLGAFSVAILRARALAGRRLPCGCFGGRRELDYRLMLARNAGLGALASLALAAPGRPVDDFGLPVGSDVLPALLVGAGLVVALWTLRSTSAGLRR